jgi:hypothetical protein
MRSNIKLGKISGIEIGLHYSWFIIAALIVFSLGDRFHQMNPSWSSRQNLEDMAAAMGLLVLGFPLTPATIRATLLGWILVVVSITRFRFGHSQIAQTCTPKLCHKESTRG